MISESFEINSLGYDVRIGYHKKTMITRGRTLCCGLGTLSMGNNVTLQQIQEVIDDIKKESSVNDSNRRNGAEKAVFVITLPTEKTLEHTLEEFGFKMIYEFHRRDCYPQNDLLKMWIYSWE